MTPSLAPAVSTAASEPPAAKRHRAVFTNLLLARILTASPRKRTTSSDFQGISMGGTGLEPVTPSLSGVDPVSLTPSRLRREPWKGVRGAEIEAAVSAGVPTRGGPARSVGGEAAAD